MEDIGMTENITRNLLDSSDFREVLKNLMIELTSTRNSLPPQGYKWKRTPQDRLEEMGCFQPDYFISEFKLISSRSSKLSSELREFIKVMIYRAMNKTLILRQRKNTENNGKEK